MKNLIELKNKIKELLKDSEFVTSVVDDPENDNNLIVSIKSPRPITSINIKLDGNGNNG